MSNTLVSSAELTDFPGAPFDDYAVDIAAASVRADAGWHIAPVVTETLTVDSFGGQLLVLPTRRITAVTAIRNVTDGTEVVTGWRRMTTGIYRRAGWPIGTIEVDLSHGYAKTPLELLPVIARRVSQAPREPGLASHSITRGPFSESSSYRGGASGLDPVVARYAVPAGIA